MGDDEEVARVELEATIGSTISQVPVASTVTSTVTFSYVPLHLRRQWDGGHPRRATAFAAAATAGVTAGVTADVTCVQELLNLFEEVARLNVTTDVTAGVTADVTCVQELLNLFEEVARLNGSTIPGHAAGGGSLPPPPLSSRPISAGAVTATPLESQLRVTRAS